MAWYMEIKNKFAKGIFFLQTFSDLIIKAVKVIVLFLQIGTMIKAIGDLLTVSEE